MMAFLELTEAQIETWHGVSPPNDAARRMAADIASVIAAYEQMRGRLRFEDEPASFAAALQAVKEKAA
jgi:hypothetical protein